MFYFTLEIGEFLHPCEEDLVCKSTMSDKVPYFNAPVYLENKSQIGKVDDIFGQFRSYVSLTFFKRCHKFSQAQSLTVTGVR